MTRVGTALVRTRRLVTTRCLARARRLASGVEKLAIEKLAIEKSAIEKSTIEDATTDCATPNA